MLHSGKLGAKASKNTEFKTVTHTFYLHCSIGLNSRDVLIDSKKNEGECEQRLSYWRKKRE